MTAPLPTIIGDLTIQGPGAKVLTVSSAGNNFGIFQNVNTANITGLTIANGSATPVQPTQPNQPTPPAYGGGIYNQGSLDRFGGSQGILTVQNCNITGNSAQLGGGIANVGGSATISNSTISRSGGGGGVYSIGSSQTINGTPTPLPAVTSIINSTVSSNQGNGVTAASGVLNLNYSTVAFNSVSGLDAATGSDVRVYNSIIASNGEGDANGTAASVTSNGYNLVVNGNAATAFNNTGDQTGVNANPRLAPLDDNGGLTPTHALFAGSSAINRGAPNPIQPPPFDQRGVGFPRVFGGQIDIGSFEKQNNDPVVSVTITPRTPGTNTVLTATVQTDASTLSYQWFRKAAADAALPGNGAALPGETNRTLDLSQPGNGDRGDIISVVVAGSTGNTSATDTDQVTVANTAPSFTLALTPPNPTTNERVTATTTATDPDGDAVTFSYRWTVTRPVRNADGTLSSDQTQAQTEVLATEIGPVLDLSRPGNGNRDDIVTLTVTASDANGGTAQQTAAVTVANSAPVASNIPTDPNSEGIPVAPGATVSVLLQGTDPDGDALTFALASQATQGTATVGPQTDANGNSLNNGRFVLTYTANANATGTDRATYTATDTNTAPAGQPSNALTSAPATVKFRISGTPVTPTPTPVPTPTPKSDAGSDANSWPDADNSAEPSASGREFFGQHQARGSDHQESGGVRSRSDRYLCHPHVQARGRPAQRHRRNPQGYRWSVEAVLPRFGLVPG